MREIGNVFRETTEWLLTIALWIVVGILIVIMLAACGIGFIIWVMLVVSMTVFVLLQNLILSIFGKHK
jgi:hypothetical protein